MKITGRGKVVFIFWVYVKVGNSWKQKYIFSLASKWKISAGKKFEKICFKYGLHQHLCNEPQTLQSLFREKIDCPEPPDPAVPTLVTPASVGEAQFQMCQLPPGSTIQTPTFGCQGDFWYRCYYLHRSREPVYPVCGIFWSQGKEKVIVNVFFGSQNLLC